MAPRSNSTPPPPKRGTRGRRSKGSNNDLATQAAQGAESRVVGWGTLITGAAICGFLWWRNHDTANAMTFDEYNLLNTALILWVPLLLVLFAFRREPTEFGLTVGDTGKGLWVVLAAFVLFVPVILLTAPQPGPQEYYRGWLAGSGALSGPYFIHHGGAIVWKRLLYHETVMGFYMFGWEFFFRGFLLNGLRRTMPLWVAVVVQALLFMAMHWSKPPAEVASSFPGAIIMALLALRYRSFLPCFMLHYLVSAGFDGAVLYYHFH